MFLVAPPFFGSSTPPDNATFIGVTPSSSANIIPHANSLVGDIGVLIDRVDFSIPPTVIPANFTQMLYADITGSYNSKNILSAGFLSNGASTTVTGMNGGNKLLFVFRPNRSASNLVTLGSDFALQNGNPSDTSVVVASPGRLNIAIGFAGSSGTPNLVSSPTLQNPTLNEGLIAGYNIRANPPSFISQSAGTGDNGAGNINAVVIIGVV